MPTPSQVSPKADSFFLFGRGVDLTVIAGGLTFLLFPLSILVATLSTRLNTFGFLFLLFLCNFPHYMATNYRVYRSRSQIQRYRFFSIQLTAVLLLTALGAVYLARTEHANAIVKGLYTFYFLWSPYHYTGQNYGIAIMYLRRGGSELQALDRRLLYASFVSCFLMYFLLVNMDTKTGGHRWLYQLNLPEEWVRGGYLLLLVIGLACAGAFLTRIRRGTSLRKLQPVLLLTGSQFLWFAFAAGVPVLVPEAGLQNLAIEGLFPAIAFLHCAQYVGVTAYYTRRETEAEGHTFSLGRYFAILVIGGALLWVGSTRLMAELFSVDYGLAFLIMLSLINLHHFLMDGAIWKLRDGRLARLLIGSDASLQPVSRAPTAEAAGPDASRRERRRRQREQDRMQSRARRKPAGSARPSPWQPVLWIGAALAALVLTGSDLVYRIGMYEANERARRGDGAGAVALYQTVSAVNHRSSEALEGLAYWELSAGRVDASAERWERALELNPASVYALLGLSEVYLRKQRSDDAIALLERAIQIQPGVPYGYLLLAQAHEQRGDGEAAAAVRRRAGEAPVRTPAARVFY